MYNISDFQFIESMFYKQMVVLIPSGVAKEVVFYIRVFIIGVSKIYLCKIIGKLWCGTVLHILAVL